MQKYGISKMCGFYWADLGHPVEVPLPPIPCCTHPDSQTVMYGIKLHPKLFTHHHYHYLSLDHFVILSQLPSWQCQRALVHSSPCFLQVHLRVLHTFKQLQWIIGIQAFSWRHGRHLENMTWHQKLDPVNGCVFRPIRKTIVPKFIQIRLQTTEP